MDEAIAQDNSIQDESIEFTPSMLFDIVDELKDALEYEPEVHILLFFVAIINEFDIILK